VSADADTRRLLYLRDTIIAIEERARMGREAVLWDIVENHLAALRAVAVEELGESRHQAGPS
jgi:hypothetical protein